MHLAAAGALFAATLCALASCTGNFDEVNRNPNEVTEDEIQRENYKTGANIKGLISLVVPAEEHIYQFNELLVGCSFAGYAEGTPDGWLNKFSTFNPTMDWLKWPFVNVMSETYPYYRGVLKGTDDEVMHALADVLRVAIMHRMTDTYGPIPYSKVIDPQNKKESLAVAYDSQKEVYTRLFADLDRAIGVLTANSALPAEAFGKFDGVYGGDISRWARYANSLKLRMAMRLYYIDSAWAQTAAAEAIAAGVITSNADNAALTLGENRSALCWNDWKDHRVGADIICYMNGYNDPRRAAMFTQVSIGTGDAAKPGYAGIRIGCNPASKDDAIDGYSNRIIDGKTPYLWFNAAEATFLRAEYELHWGSAETAGKLYAEAVRLSFEEHGTKGAEEYLAQADARPEAYVDNVGGTFNCPAQSDITLPWETGDGPEIAERNLERIITQKWIAIFPLGTEAWAEYRRTGYPRLMPAAANKSGGTVDTARGARRLNYPSEEATENADNLAAAVSMLGGEDNCGTRLWWDVKPYNN